MEHRWTERKTKRRSDFSSKNEEDWHTIIKRGSPRKGQENCEIKAFAFSIREFSIAALKFCLKGIWQDLCEKQNLRKVCRDRSMAGRRNEEQKQ